MKTKKTVHLTGLFTKHRQSIIITLNFFVNKSIRCGVVYLRQGKWKAKDHLKWYMKNLYRNVRAGYTGWWVE